MIGNDQELQATLERVRQFQLQVANLRRVERNPENYRLSASGYLADGLSLDYFLESFPSVTREQAAAVLRYGWQRIEGELAA